MKKILGIFLFFMSVSQVQASINEVIARSSITSPAVAQGRRYWVDLAAKSNSSLEEKGIQISVGHRWDLFGVDLRLSYGQTEFGAIRGVNDYTQGYSGIYHDPVEGTELLRPRNIYDRWNYVMIEPALSVEGKILPSLLPLLSERARAGFSWGRFSDLANALSFTAHLFTVETALIYQLGASSPFSIVTALYWNTGNMSLNSDEVGLAKGERNLPASWVGTSLGILYSF